MMTPFANKRFMQSAKILAFVTFVGPPIGAAIYLALIAARALGSSGWDGGSTSEIFQSAVSIGGLIILFTYLLGGLPSFLSGLALARHVYAGANAISVQRAVATAVVATFLASAVMHVLGGPRSPSILFALMPAAIVSSIATLFLMRRLRLLRRT